MARQSQEIGFYQNTASDLVKWGRAIPSIPADLWQGFLGAQVQYCAFKRQRLSTLQESFFVHFYFGRWNNTAR